MFENLNDFLTQLDQLKPLQDLLKSGKLTRTDNGDLEFSDGETTLSISTKDNGFKVSLTTEHIEGVNEETQEDLTRREFERFCDSIDDETFEQTCNLYAEKFMPVKELNDNLTQENIADFVNCLIELSGKELTKHEQYIHSAKIYLSEL